jgi:regulator of protease activity HflC (stomatin/prohibitin superfamily)
MNIAQLFQFVASIAWFGFIAVLIVTFVRASRNQGTKGMGALVLGIFVIAALLSIVSAGLIFIEPTERGVVVTAVGAGGIRSEPLGSGLHWIIPFVERTQRYSIARQTYTMSAAVNEGEVVGDDSIRARTKDGQEVFVDASVIYQIDADKVVALHIDWQDRYEDELVRPSVRGIIRDAASQYGVEEIVSSKRAEMEALITEQMEAKFIENDLVLIDFVLRDIHFSEEYAVAVEQKQIAEQQAQQAKFVVESKKQEAEQARQVAQGQADAAVIAAKGAAEARIIQAEAEAKALELIADALRGNSDLLMYQYITKLSPNVRVMFLPSGAPFILPTQDMLEAIPE